MKELKENEIEVLGADVSPNGGKRRNWRWLWLGGAAAVLILVVALVSCPGRKSRPAEVAVMTEVEQAEISAPKLQPSVRQRPVVAETDSINDVVLTFYPVDSLKASVTFQAPDSTDANVIIATPAADYRADGKGIVGDFIIDRQQLARGERKAGWCYVSPEGALTIGTGEAENTKSEALERGGCFFRQYALVMDGEICQNVLKGKAKRRAIAFLNGKPVVVTSRERESIYDFSQALADYGFSHALYLPGGEGLWKCVNAQEDVYRNFFPADTPALNYILFSLK